MGVIKFLLHLVFGEKKKTLEQEIVTEEKEEKEIEREEQQEETEAAKEIGIEEKEEKEEEKLLELENLLGTIIEQQKGITTNNIQQLRNILQEMHRQLSVLIQDQNLLEKGIEANEQTVKLSMQNITQEEIDVGKMETDISTVMDETLKSKMLGNAEKIKGEISALKGLYTNISSGIIQKQKQILSKAKELLQKMPGLLQELDKAVNAGKSADAIRKDQEFINFTKQSEQYIRDIENLSKSVINFNEQAKTHDKIIERCLQEIQVDWIQSQTAAEAQKS